MVAILTWVRWYHEVSSFQVQRGWMLFRMSTDPFYHPLSPSDSVPTMSSALFSPILPICSIQNHLHASLYPLLLLSDFDYALPRLISIFRKSGHAIRVLGTHSFHVQSRTPQVQGPQGTWERLPGSQSRVLPRCRFTSGNCSHKIPSF